MKPLTLAYSPCPNDTFIFTPWVEGHISGAPPVVERYEDIDTLNRIALGGEPDIVKVSFHALGHLREDDVVLNDSFNFTVTEDSSLRQNRVLIHHCRLRLSKSPRVRKL